MKSVAGDRDQTLSEAQERYYLASQWQLMWRKFRHHRMAIIGGAVLAVFYFLAIFANFLIPYDPMENFPGFQFMPPSRIHIISDGKLTRPYVYEVKRALDKETRESTFSEIKETKYPIRFFAKGHDYKLLGIFPTSIHLFGVEEPGKLYLFGTDSIGRCLLSRSIYGARISLSIGLVGVLFSFIIGVTLGGISGYYGGRADMIIQRIIEFMISIPSIPLWMALAAALPREWSILQVYFAIVVILSLVRWGSLARVVRGKLLELRVQDFIMAARVSGMKETTIIRRHLLPSFASYLIVHLTLAVPSIILAETALSFLGLGLRSPAVSWGVLLQKAQNVRSVAVYPWNLIPAVFVIITVMAFNFLGDGLRDAADPYR